MTRTIFHVTLAGLSLALVGCGGGATTSGAPGAQASNNPKGKVDDLPPANPIPQAKETLAPVQFKSPNNPIVDDPPAQKNKSVAGAPKTKTVTGTVKSVGGGSIVVSVGGQDQSYAIRADAFISQQRNRQPVALDAVHAGAVAEVCVDLASNQATSVHLLGNNGNE